MSKVITFSRTFPKHHRRAGELTNFVEKVWKSIDFANLDWFKFGNEYEEFEDLLNDYISTQYLPKRHTIRAGHRWKRGEFFSPRYWSGIPRRSKQITFAPDIQIKKIWNIEISSSFLGLGYEDFILIDGEPLLMGKLTELAENDGLPVEDFTSWFGMDKKKTVEFSGQILCWDESVNY